MKYNLKPSTENCFLGFDLSEKSNADEKQAGLINSKVDFYKQDQQLKNPEIRIVFDDISFTAQLAKYAQGLHGQGTFDKECYTLTYWELNTFGEAWEYQQTTPKNISKDDFGASRVFRWEKGKGMLYDFMELKKQDGYTSGKWKAGTQIWGKTGLAVSGMGRLFFTKYLGYAFDENVAVLFTDDEKILNYINAYCFSGNFENELKKIDQNLKASCNTLVKVPFDLDHWQKVAAEKYPNGLPQPYSDDPTQWLFHGHPVKAERPLQVALARLLGYRWPAESDSEMELAPEVRELIGAVQAFNPLSDEDGIVCIPPVNGEYAGAERLRAFLQAVYGEAWSNATLAQLLAQEGSKKTNLEDWLREEFFEQHFKLFHHRPFLWHIWDGRKDGFSAIVNYHRLSKENLQKLIYTYLGDWLRQCDAKVKAGESGADGLRSAAGKLKEKLERILEGEPPYDIFVRWKSLDQQPLGWDPDLNDGVRLNIRPFMEADVLRKKPNIKWGVDRGKNPPGSAWGAVRDNDRHLTLGEKRAARGVEK